MSYHYWNDFVSQWFLGKKAILSWTDPDTIPLLNDPDKKDKSTLYVPEPWWGNDGSQPLHSVIINYNPGSGRQIQQRASLSYYGSYANDIVNSGVLPDTCCWHSSKRALPILSALKRCGHITGNYGWSNHLSIEMIPWHTKTVNADYWRYVKQNIKQIYENILCFAAEESRNITNNKLKSVVLLRMGEAKIRCLINDLNANRIQARFSQKMIFGDAILIEFSIPSIQGVRFYGISGRRLRNNLPLRNDLDAIINAI